MWQLVPLRSAACVSCFLCPDPQYSLSADCGGTHLADREHVFLCLCCFLFKDPEYFFLSVDCEGHPSAAARSCRRRGGPVHPRRLGHGGPTEGHPAGTQWSGLCSGTRRVELMFRRVSFHWPLPQSPSFPLLCFIQSGREIWITWFAVESAKWTQFFCWQRLTFLCTCSKWLSQLGNALFCSKRKPRKQRLLIYLFPVTQSVCVS